MPEKLIMKNKTILLESQLENIKFLFKEEESRQESIEKKLISLQGQIVLYISIISIYFATILSIFQNLTSFIFLSIIFSSCLILAWISLVFSTKILNPSSYVYMTISPETLILKRKNVNDLYSELINDFVISTNKNHKTNSMKADELILAHKLFRIAIFTGVLMILFSIISILYKNILDSIIQELIYCIMQHFA